MPGRLVSPRKGGAGLYVASGISREATQELGGWRSSEVMGKVRSKARSEEVLPELRAGLKRASDRLDMERFSKELKEAVTLVGENEVGWARSNYRRKWYA